MVFEHIEELKRAYTDKYVVVDASRPELKRFEGITGTVKTVNMSGKALVEFDAYENIGWYDIDVDYLKIVDKPLPKAGTKEKAPQKAPAAKPTPAPAAGKQPAGKMGVEQMLAAARAEKSGAAAKPAAKPATAAAGMSTADVLAAARGQRPATAKAEEETSESGAGKVAQPDAAQPATAMSTAEILAAARAGKPATSSTPTSSARTATAEPKAAVEPVTEQQVASEPAVEATAEAEITPRAELPTTVAEIVAFCRQHDRE